MWNALELVINLGSRYNRKIHSGPEVISTNLNSKIATRFIYFTSLTRFRNRIRRAEIMKYHHSGSLSPSVQHLRRPSLGIACSPTPEKNPLYRTCRSSRSLPSWDFAALAGLVEGAQSSQGSRQSPLGPVRPQTLLIFRSSYPIDDWLFLLHRQSLTNIIPILRLMVLLSRNKFPMRWKRERPSSHMKSRHT